MSHPLVDLVMRECVEADHKREQAILTMLLAKPRLPRIMIFDQLQKRQPSITFVSVNKSINHLLKERFIFECQSIRSEPKGLSFGLDTAERNTERLTERQDKFTYILFEDDDLSFLLKERQKELDERTMTDCELTQHSIDRTEECIVTEATEPAESWSDLLTLGTNVTHWPSKLQGGCWTPDH